MVVERGISTSGRGEPLCALARPFGRGAAADRARREAQALSEREALVKPHASYRVFPVIARRGDVFDLGELSVRVPHFAAYGDEVEALAAGACTVGPDLERRVSELFAARRPFLALALDRLGTEVVYRLSDRTLASIRGAAKAQGLKAADQANPGDRGIELDQQAAVLAIAGAAECGVTLTSSGMLSPRKSVSFVVAMGRNLPEQTVFGRCRRCPSRDRCPVR